MRQTLRLTLIGIWGCITCISVAFNIYLLHRSQSIPRSVAWDIGAAQSEFQIASTMPLEPYNTPMDRAITVAIGAGYFDSAAKYFDHQMGITHARDIANYLYHVSYDFGESTSVNTPKIKHELGYLNTLQSALEGIWLHPNIEDTIDVSKLKSVINDLYNKLSNDPYYKLPTH